jgi:hypothetical protein
MRIRVYVDEDVPLSFSEALIHRGVDQQAGNKGLSDSGQLAYAATNGRIIVTHNKRDFILLHTEYIRSRRAHAGIVVADQLPVSATLRRFMKLWFSVTADDMADRLEFLSSWK